MPVALPLPSDPAESGAGLPPIHALLDGAAGQVTLQSLRPGATLAMTHGEAARVLWLGRRRMTASRLAAVPELAPVLIRRGALGEAGPERDLLLSPEHRVLYSDRRARAWFGAAELPVAAVQLTFLPGVEQIAPCDVLYVHAILDRTGAMRLNGCRIDGAVMRDTAMADPANPRRQELLRLFPELVTVRGCLSGSALPATAAG